MTIAEKIRQSFESATGLRLLYATNEEINRAISYARMPCGFFTLLSSGEVVNYSSGASERVEVTLAVITLADGEPASYSNEERIELCKVEVLKWLKSLRTSDTLRVTDEFRTQRVYDEFDDVVTGFSVTLTLEDLVPQCGDNPHEPYQVKEVEPKGFEQTILPDDGYLALSKVVVGAVTAEVDPNIKPENIKIGVEILGVEGVLEDPQIWIDRYEEAERVIGVQSEQIADQAQTISQQGQTIAEQAQTISTALTDLNATNGTEEASLPSATDVTETSRQSIAEAIIAKGVDVPEGTGLVEMASKVEQIQQGGFDWGGSAWDLLYDPLCVGDVVMQARRHLTILTDRTTTRMDAGGTTGVQSQIYYYASIAEVNMLALTHLNTTCFANATSTAHVKYYLPEVTDTITGADVFYLSRASEIIMPKFKWLKIGTSSTFFRGCGGTLGVLVVGAIDNTGGTALNINAFFSSPAGVPNLRLFDVGYTDRSLLWLQWSAANVIAEGEAAQLELIANARTGLLERVQDHTGEVDVRSITAAWVNTLMDSPYMSVVDATVELLADFADKGWSLGG